MYVIIRVLCGATMQNVTQALSASVQKCRNDHLTAAFVFFKRNRKMTRRSTIEFDWISHTGHMPVETEVAFRKKKI